MYTILYIQKASFHLTNSQFTDSFVVFVFVELSDISSLHSPNLQILVLACLAGDNLAGIASFLASVFISMAAPQLFRFVFVPPFAIHIRVSHNSFHICGCFSIILNLSLYRLLPSKLG